VTIVFKNGNDVDMFRVKDHYLQKLNVSFEKLLLF
jgi:hypothetical protein